MTSSLSDEADDEVDKVDGEVDLTGFSFSVSWVLAGDDDFSRLPLAKRSARVAGGGLSACTLTAGTLAFAGVCWLSDSVSDSDGLF